MFSRKWATNSRSSSENGYAAASSGLAMGMNFPRARRTDIKSRLDASRSASVSVGAHTTETVRIRCDLVKPPRSGRRLEPLFVRPRGAADPLRAEVVRERVAEAALRREPRAPVARTQNPHRRQRHVVGQGAHTRNRAADGERFQARRRRAIRRASRGNHPRSPAPGATPRRPVRPNPARGPGRGRCGRDATPPARGTPPPMRSGAWLGNMMPPEPMRMRRDTLARWPMRTSGEVETTLGRLWCSLTQ